MKYVTEGYEPRDALRFFEDIAAIPRGSNNERAVARYIYNWGKDLGLEAYKDEANNVILRKPGSKGCEDLPIISLQGHTDIVAVKLPESDHNFETDPLPLYVDDKGCLRSRGTTLGADNGNAVAYMMAVLARNDLVHPPLECIFTSGEEIGLVGATKLDGAQIKGDRLINMDAGGLNQAATTVSCAGGLEMKHRTPAEWTEAKGSFVEIFIHGLQGGHSAGAIDKGRGNAGKIWARIVNHVSLFTKVNVVSAFGGKMQNAIQSDIKSVIAVEDLDIALREIEKTANDVKDELRVTDPGFVCDVKVVEKADKMLTDEKSKNLVGFVLAVPVGVRDFNPEIKGAVLNSNNLAGVSVSDDEIMVWTLGRSNTDTMQEALGEEVRALAEVFGYKSDIGAHFFGWKYNPDSKLRALHTKLFKETFGIDLVPTATHGGLECGVFYGKKPTLDIICFGPKGDGAHTPEEYLDLASFKEIYDYLIKFLEELTKV